MKYTIIIIIALAILAQFIQIEKTNPISDPALEIKAPKEIKTLLVNACYDCHSNNTKWPWYSNIAPMSWAIKNHVEDGRKWLNFSTWENYTKEEKQKKVKELFRSVHSAMPPSDYMYWHDEAKLTKEQRKLIRDWTGVMGEPNLELLGEHGKH
jgi:hypothetical protein